MCEGAHRLLKCRNFNNTSVEDRRTLIKDRLLCNVCFCSRHVTRHCNVTQRCEKCWGKHHVLLLHHVEQNASGSEDQHETQPTWNSVRTGVVGEITIPFLLMTAVVNVRDRSGQLQQVRALLDSASETSVVSENIVQSLGLRKIRTSIPIAGISTSLAGRVQVDV
jgi:hypothetical protein